MNTRVYNLPFNTIVTFFESFEDCKGDAEIKKALLESETQAKQNIASERDKAVTAQKAESEAKQTAVKAEGTAKQETQKANIAKQTAETAAAAETVAKEAAQKAESEATLQRNYSFSLAGLAALLLLLVAYQWRKTQKQKVLLETTNTELHAKNIELDKQKSTITNQLDEIRHRVRNNLAALDGFIKTQKRNNKLPELVPPLERCRESIISMGRVNTALYQEDDWNKVSVKSYLESLMGVVLDAMNNNGRVIGFSLDICAAAEIRHWDTKEKSNLGFIVNELLSNASKYAFANQSKPHIHIAMQAQAGEQNILLTVQDNGCGIDKARYETRTKESLGMTIVSRSARTLGGDTGAVTYENLPEGGTIFYIPIQIQ
jgi:two-component sensor histidine kinase